ncbi:MAG: hypothetical protein HRJ53_18905 [Acidobacteria bacterium Pan2503]|uniref:Uncharacterized protein n=1 Tax=Candidatus Acidiferrum panamense TaxID=2741543 RepID=A0A7V8SYG2_9BACT|nr:hypothetical protein [Candidatus Acidoferrum panamensis]
MARVFAARFRHDIAYCANHRFPGNRSMGGVRNNDLSPAGRKFCEFRLYFMKSNTRFLTGAEIGSKEEKGNTSSSTDCGMTARHARSRDFA